MHTSRCPECGRLVASCKFKPPHKFRHHKPGPGGRANPHTGWCLGSWKAMPETGR